MIMGVSDIPTGLILGASFSLSLFLTGITIVLLAGIITPNARLAVIVIVSASMITIVSLLMQAWFYDLAIQTATYISLLALNCLVIALAEEKALPSGMMAVLSNGILLSVFVLLPLLLIGGVRQLFGLTLLNEAPGGFLLLALSFAIINAFSPVLLRSRDLQQ